MLRLDPEDLDVVAPLERIAARASAESDCWSVISEVSTMKTNGSRNMSATAIATLWFAIAKSRRRRRTVQGTLRLCERGMGDEGTSTALI